MNQKNKSAIQVIAYAIEKDTESLKQLLRKNGIFTDVNTTKDELQTIVTTALGKSKSFPNQFKNWVLKRSKVGNYVNSTGTEIPTGIGYNFGSATQLSSTSTPSFGGMLFTDELPNLSQNATSPTDIPKDSPWKLSINDILDFAKTGMNNFVLVQQSKSDRDIANAALEAKRLELQTQNNPLSAANPNKTLYLVLGVIGFIGLVGGIIYYQKNKK